MVHQTHMGRYCKYNQYAVLNHIIGDKLNNVVIVNPKNNKGNMIIYIHKRLRADSLYTYAHTYTNIQHLY